MDLEEAERFWTEVVGLDLVLRYGEAASFLSRGGYHHHVGVNRFAPWVDPEGAPAGIRRAEIELTPGLPAPRRLVSPEGIEIVVR